MARTPGEVAPTDVDLSDYAAVIDVRPAAIRARCIPATRNVPIDELLDDPTAALADTPGPILLVCDMGMRSHIGAERLADLGFAVDSLAGGIEAWEASGLPIETSSALSAADRERYDRHIKLAEFGVPGQAAVSAATVTIVGAGGLGVPAAQYLAAGGVGRLRIIDDDTVELSNLHRQPAYRADDVGADKVAALARDLTATNPSIRVEPIVERLTAENADELIEGSDVIVDATDRFPARYAISDSAQRLGIPVVFAAVYRWEGQLAVFAPGGPCYRCVFPTPPDPGVALDCAVTGVLGPVVGTLGSMQATEVLRLLATPSDVATGSLRLLDARRGSVDTVTIGRRDECPGCGGGSGVVDRA